MRKGVPGIDSKHFSGKRTGVTSEEIKTWLELWPDVRKKVVSNEEAYKALSTMGIKDRDPRTVKAHIESMLPLMKMGAISAAVDLINYCESRMPVRDFIRQIRESLPIEELAPKLASLAEEFIKDAPPPDQVVQALGSILSGGFPFDVQRRKK